MDKKTAVRNCRYPNLIYWQQKETMNRKLVEANLSEKVIPFGVSLLFTGGHSF